MRNSYIIDTNVLIEDHRCIDVLKNGEENWIYVTRTTIEELDKLKDKKPHLKSRIFDVLEEIQKHIDDIKLISLVNERTKYDNKDNKIIDEILENKDSIKNPILVTNDKILRFKASKKGIQVEDYKTMNPYKHESEKYTGFDEAWPKEEKVNNCFYWYEGKLNFYSNKNEYPINYENTPWKIKPLNHYQNCFMDLMLNDNIDLVTVQSGPGFGKTYLSLATALYQVFEKKKYEKIYVVKSNYEIGNQMGFLPGAIDEKMMPYFKPIHNFIMKLHKSRNIPKKVFDNSDVFGLNKEYIEFLPINFLRGVDWENSIVIVEEIQNLSRADARSLLSRMGNNVKCVCTGDIGQIDNPYLDKNNNAMNWIVKLFKGESNYAHITLKGKQTRGPICQLVINKDL